MGLEKELPFWEEGVKKLDFLAAGVEKKRNRLNLREDGKYERAAPLLKYGSFKGSWIGWCSRRSAEDVLGSRSASRFGSTNHFVDISAT